MVENGIQVSPPGFHVIFLPFTEDIRKLELPEPKKGNLIIFVDGLFGVFNWIYLSCSVCSYYRAD